MLVTYPWPGNVRELRNAIERALILARGQLLEPESFPERIAASHSDAPVLGGDFKIDDIEREHALRVMAHAPTMEEGGAHPRNRRLHAVAHIPASLLARDQDSNLWPSAPGARFTDRQTGVVAGGLE